jgi:LDH2 family malate/lactate/ureidoglycolate dehydrogenase
MVGLSADEAATCADAVMFASLRGLDSHGMISIMPAIARNVARGTIVPGARIGVIGETATTAVLKGNGAAGPLVAAKAMDLAIAKAREYGLGAVTAFNCHHFGAASAYCARALPEKMIAI